MNVEIKSNIQIDQFNKLNCVKQCFDQIQSINNNSNKDLQKLINYLFVNDQYFTKNLITLFKDLVRNQQQIENKSTFEEQQHQIIYSQIYSQQIRVYTVVQILKIIEKIQFFTINQQLIKKIIDQLFNLINDKILLKLTKINQNKLVFQSIKEEEQYIVLEYTLKCLIKILQDVKYQIFDYFLAKGIGSKIINIIQRTRKFKLNIHLHSKILLLINYYLTTQLKFLSKSPNYSPNTISGVSITTQSANEKQILLAYCLCYINKNQSDQYSIIFSNIKKIFQIHNYLASQIQEDLLLKVLELILFEKDTLIMDESLNLLNDFVYYSDQNVKILIQNGLLDKLFNRLQIQKHRNFVHMDQFSDSKFPATSKINIQIISYILCNTTLIQSSLLKKQILSHYIWQQVYQSMHPSSKLFPLIVTLEYFFNLLGHKNFQKYFRPYIEALSSFDWRNCAYNKQIEKTIMDEFYRAKNQWQEHEYYTLLNIIRDNGLFWMIQDKVDTGEMEQACGEIQIE